MRQAPDVVCIGEVRSEESMKYALQLAQTGHLCVFTIHANTASQTIERKALRQAVSANDLRLRIQMHDEGNNTERLYDRISDLNLMT
ncbi:Type II secretory pathway, ATPase PulE/Tfp pilus assembly pathway, ATPase PilB [Mycobacteroides abscessus subsp. massiliense]|nr:Type II secretory pathway, ATPase PulE/Tfp pilus assembly pathway, ATPase PilB [Mycobacteroides abscessus subsp. massiliense]